MDFIFETNSSKNVYDTLQDVKVALKSNGFGTLFELNFKDKFAEHEIEYDEDFYVIEVCNPHFAKKVLEISQNIGYFLPCKVVVYDNDGTTKIGMVKPTALIHMVTEEMVAFDVAKEVEDIIMKSLQNA